MSALVLIVDDDFDLRETLTDVLEDAGYGVATAADGVEALAYLRSHPPPTVILLDWMMPNCNGAQFRAEQLADPALAAIPVVLLTADTRLRDKLAELRVTTYLAKPCDRATLLSALRNYT